MDIERKKNIIFLAGSDSHECIEIQRDTENLEVIMNDKHCKLMEDCLVDIYKLLEKIDIKSVDKLKQKIKTLEAKITVLEQSNKDDNSTLIN
jgi:hypothetical protein